MNKYQKALDNLIRVSCPRKVSCKECDFEKLCNSQAKRYIDTIQELVEKATPKKPQYKELIRKDNYRDETNIPIYDWWCPNCHLEHISTNEVNYCPTCCQALDWSDE